MQRNAEISATCLKRKASSVILSFFWDDMWFFLVIRIYTDSQS